MSYATVFDGGIVDIRRLGGSTIFQKFEFDLVQLIHGAYHISKHSEGN